MARDDELAIDMVDAGSFAPVADDLAPRDPIGFPGYAEAVRAARADRTGDESVVCGPATIGGHSVEVALFSFAFFGGSMGEVAGERLARAMERAADRGVPFVVRTATGGGRMQEGMNSLVQMPKVVSARFSLASANVPLIAVLGDPTTGGVLASVAALADVTLAETGATIGFAGPRVVEMVIGHAPGAGSHTAASALANGLVDTVVEPHEVRTTIAHLLGIIAPDDPQPVDRPPEAASAADADGWDVVQAARADDRPNGPQLMRALSPETFELRGDRAGGHDEALAVALGRVLGRRVLVLALDRSKAPGPSAYRVARRALRVAERLSIPVVTLVDTRGADPSVAAEAGGIAWEIAQLSAAMLVTEVPIVSVVTGEGGSGGALAFATADVLLAYEHSIFSVIGPEGAATILWRDPARAPEAARALRLTAAELHRFGLVDALLPEPPDGTSLAATVAYHLGRVPWSSGHDLVTARMHRWRHIDGNR